MTDLWPTVLFKFPKLRGIYWLSATEVQACMVALEQAVVHHSHLTKSSFLLKSF